MHERVKILAPLLELAMRDKVQRWPTYDGGMLDRTQYVSSSEIGKCARQIWFSKNLPPIEGGFKWGYAERGHGHEAWIVSTLAEVDCEYVFRFHGKDQVSFYAGYQSGTPDGVWLSTDGGHILVDYKSIDPRTKRSNLPKKEHIDQVIQNMDIVEECLDMTFAGALLAYSDASDFSMIDEFFIDRNSPKVGERMIALEDRAEAIIKAERAEDLQPEGLYTDGCKNCAYGSQCSAAIVATKQEKTRHDQISKLSAGVFGQS